jgi:predicted transcriptional regulator
MKHSAMKEKAAKPHGLPHLRTVRQRKGLSIGQLADMTGIRRDTISHLEDGRLDPQPYHVRLLARVLEVTLLDLVS